MPIFQKQLDLLCGQAEFDFWVAVKRGTPEIQSGDLDAFEATTFTAACRSAIEAWFWSNGYARCGHCKTWVLGANYNGDYCNVCNGRPAEKPA